MTPYPIKAVPGSTPRVMLDSPVTVATQSTGFPCTPFVIPYPRIISREEKRHIMSTKAQGVAERMTELRLARSIGHIVEITIRIRRAEIPGWRDHPALHREN